MKAKRIFFLLVFLPLIALAQSAVVIWDSTNVNLTNVEIDTVFVDFRNSPKKAYELTNHGATIAMNSRPGDKAYVPDTLVVMLDSTNVSGAAADSFRIGWVPFNPITGALMMSSIVYVRATSTTFATITDGLVLGLPKIFPWVNAYALLIWRGDLNAGAQRIRTAFIRRET